MSSSVVSSRRDVLRFSAGVRCDLGAEAFRLWNADMREVVEPGLFDIMAGPNSVDLKTVTLEIA